jgi:hypothetical protein
LTKGPIRYQFALAFADGCCTGARWSLWNKTTALTPEIWEPEINGNRVQSANNVWGKRKSTDTVVLWNGSKLVSTEPGSRCNAGRYFVLGAKRRAPIRMVHPWRTRSAAGILQPLCLNAATKKLSYGGLPPQLPNWLLASDYCRVRSSSKKGDHIDRHHAKNVDDND